MALILAEPGALHAAASAQVLAGAGWRVAIVPDAARLPAAWQELFRGSGATGGTPVRVPAVPVGTVPLTTEPTGASAGSSEGKRG